MYSSRRVASEMKKSTYSRCSVTVSTVKKSQANTLTACWRRNACQLDPARRGAGSRRAAASNRRTVLGEIRTLSFLSSPLMRR